MRTLWPVLAAGLVFLSCADSLDVPEVPDQVAVMVTSLGTVELLLHAEETPLAVANFAGLAQRRVYDGTIFHRVIPGFMIQGGDPTGTGFGGQSLWGGAFEDEFSDALRYDRPGQVGMANAGPDTNRSQFFITLTSASHLNDKHTLFATVLSGMDVVEAIAAVETDARDRPLEPVEILKLTIVYR